MDIYIYNTLTRAKEAFTPLHPGEVSMYNCGPTVYDTPHIGNYRTYVMNDIIRRVFEFDGFRVNQAMNITDVDDKTIRRSREERTSLGLLTNKYEEMFFEGCRSLNILRPHHVMRATDNIAPMITLVQELLKAGVAYTADDGVYVSIAKVRNYGALAHLLLNAAIGERDAIDGERHTASRIASDEYDKEDPRDFAVWKFATAEDGDAAWPSPFGPGRPGWHIECSAMSMKIFGTTMDIHTGASDLIFPHHTNEIAQSESATGKPFVRYWMHGGFMNVGGEKMAKSKGNFIKLVDLADESVSPLAYRYWLLTAHYRSPVNFSIDAVYAAQNALVRMIKLVGGYPKIGSIDASYSEAFRKAVNDDMDMPKAVSLAWDLTRDRTVSDGDKHATLLDFDRIFGLGLDRVPRAETEKIPEEILALAEAREDARKAHDWKKADALRTEIENRGYILTDTPEGMKLRSAS